MQPGGTATRVARDVRQYLVITALTGLGFSLVVYVLMLVVGTDLALVWAVLAFIMNYVPNVGIILSVVPPVILTLLELGWQRALVVLAGFLVLDFSEGFDRIVNKLRQDDLVRLYVLLANAANSSLSLHALILTIKVNNYFNLCAS